MNISSRFNRFYHKCVLVDLYNKTNTIIFNHLMDTSTGATLVINKYEDYNDMEDLKQLLKLLNLDYAVDEEKDKKVSTKDINSKALMQHIEWCIEVGNYNGVELDFVKAEWDRIKMIKD